MSSLLFRLENQPDNMSSINNSDPKPGFMSRKGVIGSFIKSTDASKMTKMMKTITRRRRS